MFKFREEASEEFSFARNLFEHWARISKEGYSLILTWAAVGLSGGQSSIVDKMYNNAIFAKLTPMLDIGKG